MKKIVLFIMMFLCSIMPIHANSLASITIELQDSIDDLSKENVDFKLVQVAKLEDGYFVFTTNHFSEWAIVQSQAVQPLSLSASISLQILL